MKLHPKISIRSHESCGLSRTTFNQYSVYLFFDKLPNALNRYETLMETVHKPKKVVYDSRNYQIWILEKWNISFW